MTPLIIETIVTGLSLITWGLWLKTKTFPEAELKMRKKEMKKAWFVRVLTGNVISAKTEEGDIRIVKLAGLEAPEERISKEALGRYMPGPARQIWIKPLQEDEDGHITGYVYRNLNKEDTPLPESINKTIKAAP